MNTTGIVAYEMTGMPDDKLAQEKIQSHSLNMEMLLHLLGRQRHEC